MHTHGAIEKTAADIGNYAVEQWNYLWSSEYGPIVVAKIENKGKQNRRVRISFA